MSEYLNKNEVLRMLDLNITKWTDLKGKEQDVTHENFIDDVILVYRWVLNDIEKM